MEPFSIAIIGAILGAVATQTPRALRTLKRAIVGKKVCAIGPKQVGKSTFLEFLSKGMVIGIDEYRSTVSSVKLGGREVVVSDKNSNQEMYFHNQHEAYEWMYSHKHWILKKREVIHWTFSLDQFILKQCLVKIG